MSTLAIVLTVAAGWSLAAALLAPVGGGGIRIADERTGNRSTTSVDDVLLERAQ